MAAPKKAKKGRKATAPRDTTQTTSPAGLPDIEMNPVGPSSQSTGQLVQPETVTSSYQPINHFEVLGVSDKASKDEILRVYKSKIPTTPQEGLQKLIAAADVLTDESKRVMYMGRHGGLLREYFSYGSTDELKYSLTDPGPARENGAPLMDLSNVLSGSREDVFKHISKLENGIVIGELRDDPESAQRLVVATFNVHGAIMRRCVNWDIKGNPIRALAANGYATLRGSSVDRTKMVAVKGYEKLSERDEGIKLFESLKAKHLTAGWGWNSWHDMKANPGRRADLESSRVRLNQGPDAYQALSIFSTAHLDVEQIRNILSALFSAIEPALTAAECENNKVQDTDGEAQIYEVVSHADSAIRAITHLQDIINVRKQDLVDEMAKQQQST